MCIFLAVSGFEGLIRVLDFGFGGLGPRDLYL